MGQKCPKSAKNLFPIFLYTLGKNTSKLGLNVIKYHCGVREKFCEIWKSF